MAYVHAQHKELSVISLVDTLINDAIMRRASDIHIESTQDGLRIRYRIDGMLYTQDPIPSTLMGQVVSRLKVMAHIDIAEKRVPQDGKFRVVVAGDAIDLRVSTFPGLYGEKVVVRILDRSTNRLTLSSLGFVPHMEQKFTDLIGKSTGFVLVTGPTGSGKTTTLYAALMALNKPERNIVTLEDPVEYNVDGITQAQIHPEAGFSFEKGIRSILRQDPDVVMVGEIRDKETGQVAIEAALTGHLVLSTAHTNDAASAIMRLMDMDIPPFLINASLSGVLAQRLARTICTNCKVAAAPTEEERALLARLGVKLDTLYHGKGCDSCFNLGYRGRIGIFELLIMTPALRALIVKHPQFDAVRNQAVADGLEPLVVDGLRKVQAGLITVHELFRVM